jgi:hypothetical protein
MTMNIKNLVIAITAMTALSAQAATVSLNGTITGCQGLCLVFSSIGNSVDITYDDTATNSPTLVIEGNNGNTVLFNNQMIAPDVDFFPAQFGALAGLPTPKAYGNDISTDYTTQVSVFGTGTTTGAPVWGVFDLTNNTFESYLFTPDSDGAGTPAILFLSDGTFTTASAVPVPAAAWFMVSGLVGLFGMKRAQAKK